MGAFGRFLYLAVIALMLLSFDVADAWTPASRDHVAAVIAAGICKARPQPAACAPDGRPTDFFTWWLETFG